MSIQQNHSGSGDIVGGNKTTNNNLFLNPKWLGFISFLIIGIAIYFYFNPNINASTITTIGDTNGDVTVIGPGASLTKSVDSSKTTIYESKPQPRIVDSYEGKLKSFSSLKKDNVIRYLGNPMKMEGNKGYYNYPDLKFSITYPPSDGAIVNERFYIFDKCNPDFSTNFPSASAYLPEISGISVISITEKDESLCFGSLPCLNIKNLNFIELLDWLKRLDATIFQFDFIYPDCISDAILNEVDQNDAFLYAYITHKQERYRIKIELLGILNRNLVSQQIGHFLDQNLDVYFKMFGNDIFTKYDFCLDKLANGVPMNNSSVEYYWDDKDSLILDEVGEEYFKWQKLVENAKYQNPFKLVYDFEITKKQIYNRLENFSKEKDINENSESCEYIALFDKFNRIPLAKLNEVPHIPLDIGYCGECCLRTVSCRFLKNINEISFGNFFETKRCKLDIEIDFFIEDHHRSPPQEEFDF